MSVSSRCGKCYLFKKLKIKNYTTKINSSHILRKGKKTLYKILFLASVGASYLEGTIKAVQIGPMAQSKDIN